VLEQYEANFVFILGTHEQMNQISCEIVYKSTVMKLVDEDMVVFCLDSSVNLLLDDKGFA
jgi:hypothetical protein